MIDDDIDAPALEGLDRDLDALCEAWVWWRRENRLYGPMLNFAALGKLPGGTRALRQPEQVYAAGGLAALHVAYSCQPDAIDKQVFDLYYIARVKPVKAAAAYLGIGHRQFYRVLEAFRRRLDASARAFEASTVPTAGAGAVLPLFADQEVLLDGRVISVRR